jgi:eukaryotic-like serine/threonine-protein kinase
MRNPDPSLPVRFGNYELVKLLAQGGMADVYLARQLGITPLERYVAIKVLNAHRATDAESCALFLDEARVAGMLNHCNLASVYDANKLDGVHYLAMEYVAGADLRQIMEKAEQLDVSIDYAAAAHIVMQAAAGLDYAHRRVGSDGRALNLVHRDVSLSNVMVTHDGMVKVIDFGIAVSAASQHKTNPGIVRGKASYMSPEQCLGDPVDLRTDVFALGIVLYELTTGRRCFNGNSDYERMLAIVHGEYVAPSELIQDFPVALEQVIRTALALDPAHRYPSAAAMIDALEAVALLEGWTLGATSMQRMMRELFGEPDASWSDDYEDLTYVGEMPSACDELEAELLQATRVITKPRRFPRGTIDESFDAAPVETPLYCDDDARTRGRRSVSRLYCWPLAA